MANRLREMVSGTVRDVVRADSLLEALDRLAEGFQREYDLWRASVVELRADTRMFHVVAVWSVGEPTIDANMEVPFTLTPATEAMARDLMDGRALLLDPTNPELGLLSEVYRKEGVRSWLSIPLRDEGVFWGVLNLASIREGAFEPSDIAVFSALAVGIEHHLLSLAPPAERPHDPH